MDFLERRHGRSTSFENRPGFLLVLPVIGSMTLGKLAMIPLFISLSPHLLRTHVRVSVCAIHCALEELSLVVESDVHPNDYPTV